MKWLQNILKTRSNSSGWPPTSSGLISDLFTQPASEFPVQSVAKNRVFGPSQQPIAAIPRLDSVGFGVAQQHPKSWLGSADIAFLSAINIARHPIRMGRQLY